MGTSMQRDCRGEVMKQGYQINKIELKIKTWWEYIEPQSGPIDQEERGCAQHEK